VTPEVVLRPVLPELLLVAVGIVGLLYEAFAPRSEARVHLLIAGVGIVAAGIAAITLWGWEGAPFVLGDSVAVDRFSVLASVILLSVALVACIYYASEAERDASLYRGEFFPLVSFATSGMVLIAAANDLILVFLALEILSLSLYVLTGITGRRRAGEAAMKYFLLGAFSSAFFLYGVAMAYGATASTKITAMTVALSGTGQDLALALLALAFLAIGFGFKVSAVPFHMWTPDVYQGAPTPVTAYMSAATKVAAFFALMRVFDVGFQPLSWDWTPIVAALAVASVVVGSFLAIAQSDVKRMLAYSSVAHAGFVLTGLTAADSTGIGAAMFYLVAYAIMTLGAFGIVMFVEAGREGRTALTDFAGLAARRPWLAALMTVFLLSLAGIPPTVGFIAKVTVFSAAIGAGRWWLALVGVLTSVVAAFFYLRVIVYMYMRQPEGEEGDGSRSGLPSVAVGLLAVLTLVLGVFPSLLEGVLEQASILRW
jgi:NADH-quinone oxidoreductase subunit N